MQGEEGHHSHPHVISGGNNSKIFLQSFRHRIIKPRVNRRICLSCGESRPVDEFYGDCCRLCNRAKNEEMLAGPHRERGS